MNFATPDNHSTLLTPKSVALRLGKIGISHGENGSQATGFIYRVYDILLIWQSLLLAQNPKIL